MPTRSLPVIDSQRLSSSRTFTVLACALLACLGGVNATSRAADLIVNGYYTVPGDATYGRIVVGASYEGVPPVLTQNNFALTATTLVAVGADFNIIGTSTYNLNGGSLSTPDLYVGHAAPAEFNQKSGTVWASNFLSLGGGHRNPGTYILSGGTLIVNVIRGEGSASSGYSTFHFNGGTLRTSASSDLFTQFTAYDKINVQAGGAKIEITSGTTTISRSLIHASNLGSTADGGLTKLGNGTLLLTAGNPYAGITTVSAGTLQLSNASGVALSGTSSVRVNDGGTLLFSRSTQINQATLPPITLGTAAAAPAGTRGDASSRGVTLTHNDPDAARSVERSVHRGTGMTRSYEREEVAVSGDTMLSAAAVAPATLNAGGFSQGTGGTSALSPGTVGLGALTLNSSSVIDLPNTSVLHFSDSSSQLWTGTLSVWNWSGTQTTGGGSEQILFGTTAAGLTPQQLTQVQFYSDSGTTSLGSGGLMTAYGEVIPNMTPVPEPSTWAAGILSVLALGWMQRRRLGALRSRLAHPSAR